MTTKQTKNTKATRNTFNAVSTAHDIAESILSVANCQAKIDEGCQVLHKRKITVGTLKSDCAVMAEFVRTLESGGKAEQTIKNYATAFRKAVNEGLPFSMNAYRKASKTGARTAKSSEESATVRLTVRKGADAYEVAQGLREAVNDEKFRDSYAELAAFLIDALDEYEGQ